MKIVCENCGAKYSIADEKVKGKVFKIRCKKCSESIVVRGETQEPAPEPAVAAPPAEDSLIPPPMPAGEEDEDGDAETRVFDYSGYQSDDKDPAVWHIVVDGQQQGPYTGAQIHEYLGAGSLDQETYIWREGFDDWLPIRSAIDTIPGGRAAAAPGAAAAPRAAAASDASSNMFAPSPVTAPSGGDIFGDQGGGDVFAKQSVPPDQSSPFNSGGGLFGGAAGAAAGGAGDVFSSTGPATGGLFSGGAPGAPAEEAGLFGDTGEGAGSDMFADVGMDEGDTGGGLFSSTTEETSGGPSLNEQMMTGQRHENSVLFSLSNLQALAAGPAPGAPARGGAAPGRAAPLPMMAAGGEEASGLIDIRALAGSLAAESDNTGVEDLISMGGGGFAPTLGAPVLVPQKEIMPLWMKLSIAGGALVVLAAMVILAVMALSGSDEESADILALQAQIEKMQQMSSQGGNSEEMRLLQKQLQEARAAQAGKGGSGSVQTDDEVEDEDDGEGSSGSSSKKTGSKSSRPSSSAKKPSSGGASKSSKSSSDDSSSSKSDEPSPSANQKGGSDELDDLLGGSLAKPGKKKAPAKASAASSGGGGGGVKANLDRNDVQSGMASVAGRVKNCGQGASGTVTLKIVIGRTGRVMSANATGPFAGTPVGACAARAVQTAKFPQTQNNLTVRYPFKL